MPLLYFFVLFVFLVVQIVFAGESFYRMAYSGWVW